MVITIPCILCGKEFVSVPRMDTYEGKETLFAHISRVHSAELEARYTAAYFESVSYDAAKERMM